MVFIKGNGDNNEYNCFNGMHFESRLSTNFRISVCRHKPLQFFCLKQIQTHNLVHFKKSRNRSFTKIENQSPT